jgi:hypothetical protein
VVLLSELFAFHRAEDTLMRVVRLFQGLDEPPKSTVHMLHRRIGNGEIALETREMAPKLRERRQHGVLWQVMDFKKVSI